MSDGGVSDGKKPEGGDGFRPWHEYRPLETSGMLEGVRSFADDLHRRRSIRAFSRRSVPAAVIRHALRAATSAPSGANRQPWHFAVVGDPAIKRRIREAAEVEERAFYEGRASEAWLEDLAPLGTDANKPFLEDAPWLIVVFAERSGRKRTVPDTRTTTSRNPQALPRGWPVSERPFLIIVTGHPADGAEVPDIQRKPLEDVTSWFEP